MNYNTLNKQIEENLINVCSTLKLSGNNFLDVYHRKKWYLLNILSNQQPESQIMFIAFKSTMKCMANKYIMEKEVDKEIFMKCFPYNRFSDVYQSVGRHDII